VNLLFQFFDPLGLSAQSFQRRQAVLHRADESAEKRIVRVELRRFDTPGVEHAP
jgi:hypothetical protein